MWPHLRHLPLLQAVEGRGRVHGGRVGVVGGRGCQHGRGRAWRRGVQVAGGLEQLPLEGAQLNAVVRRLGEGRVK